MTNSWHDILTPKALTKVSLDDFNTRYAEDGLDKKKAAKEIKKNTKVIAELAHRLYAEKKQSILLVLQGIDTAGKDGTIRHVMSGVNPQSCQISSFKQPSVEEMDHGFLWRIHKAVPKKGNIGIFNRSHYEDVLVVRVKNLVKKSVWDKRYERINLFEKMMVDGGITFIKCFLHISKETQRERLQARLDDSTKRWKFSKADIAERKLWDDYMIAYEEAVTRCNTKHAPWHIIPSDRKWYRNLCVSRLLRQTLEKMDPQFPPAEKDLDGIVVE